DPEPDAELDRDAGLGAVEVGADADRAPPVEVDQPLVGARDLRCEKEEDREQRGARFHLRSAYPRLRCWRTLAAAVTGNKGRWVVRGWILVFVTALMGVSWCLETEPDDLAQLAPPPPDLEQQAKSGAEIALEARFRGAALRYGGPPIAGKAAYFARLQNG